jgi:ElaB/YqjD/DUF883 family membrane-anchored ribosome-binding protein
MSNSTHFPTDPGSAAVDAAAHGADQAIRSSQRLANQALDQLAAQIENVRSHAGPALDDVAHDATSLAHRGSEALRHRSDQLRDQALHVRDATRGYIQHEPLKAVLMAAATGAALVALGTLLSHRGHR